MHVLPNEIGIVLEAAVLGYFVHSQTIAYIIVYVFLVAVVAILNIEKDGNY